MVFSSGFQQLRDFHSYPAEFPPHATQTYYLVSIQEYCYRNIQDADKTDTVVCAQYKMTLEHFLLCLKFPGCPVHSDITDCFTADRHLSLLLEGLLFILLVDDQGGCVHAKSLGWVSL